MGRPVPGPIDDSRRDRNEHVSVLLAPFASLRAGSANARFYHTDCLDVFRQLPPSSVDVIVTSPPYNLGIRYNQYEDTLSREEYLRWTSKWVAEAARVLRPDGSLFLNVGAKPSDPWTALDVAQAARAHLRLQNIIHWIKSIAIEKASAGAAAGLSRDLAVGHYKPINSDRFLNDCQEFVFHFTPQGSTALDRLALGVPYQDQSNIGRWRAALPRQHVIHSLRNDPAAGPGPAASGDVPDQAARAVPAAARTRTRQGRDGSVHRTRQHGSRVRTPRRGLRRMRRR